MQNVALEVDHVFKKFKKGELYDSLRDLVPALVGRFIKRNGNEKLQEREFWALREVCFQVNRGGPSELLAPMEQVKARY